MSDGTPTGSRVGLRVRNGETPVLIVDGHEFPFDHGTLDVARGEPARLILDLSTVDLDVDSDTIVAGEAGFPFAAFDDMIDQIDADAFEQLAMSEAPPRESLTPTMLAMFKRLAREVFGDDDSSSNR